VVIGRWLTRLLVLTLAPVLVIYANGEAAYATTRYGDVATASVGSISKKLFGWQCNVAAYWIVSDTDPRVAWVQANLQCGTGGLQDDSYLMDAEMHGSGACTMIPGTVPQKNIDEDAEQVFSLDFLGSASCAVTEVCLDVDMPSWPWEDPVAGNGPMTCADLSLGLPPGSGEGGTPLEGCPAYTPIEPWATTPKAVAVSGGWAWRSTISLRFVARQNPVTNTIGGDLTNPYAFVSTNEAGTFVTGTGADWTPYGASGSQSHASARMQNPYASPAIVSTVATVTFTGQTRTGTVGGVPPGGGSGLFKRAGFYWYVDATAGTIGGSETGYDTWSADKTDTELATSDSSIRAHGHQWSEKCLFSWGETLAGSRGQQAGVIQYLGGEDDTDPPAYVPPGGNPDDPAPVPDDPEDPDGPGGEDPYPDDDGACGDFKVWNPTTWAGAGFCALVAVMVEAIKVLGKIVDAIAGLAETIATAIIDALTGLLDALGDLLSLLFVPDLSGLGDSISGIVDGFNGSAFGDWSALFNSWGTGGASAPALSGALEPASSGCEGLGIDMDGLIPGIPTMDTMHPFDACSGGQADAAALVRLVLSVTIGLAAGFKVIELILSAMGAVKQVGIMSNNDWSGRR